MTIIRGIEMLDIYRLSKIIAMGLFCISMVFLTDESLNLLRSQTAKNNFEIKRLQYEIKLMEEQGIPVDVE